jgi:transcriptional regulator with XRE-family HTH domain
VRIVTLVGTACGASIARRLGEVMRQARTDSHLPTQVQLAAALGMEQTKLSRWELGKLLPNLVDIARVEDALRLPRGDLLLRCGAVELPDLDAERALEADRRLSDAGRSAMLSLFRLLLREAPDPRPTARKRNAG